MLKINVILLTTYLYTLHTSDTHTHTLYSKTGVVWSVKILLCIHPKWPASNTAVDKQGKNGHTNAIIIQQNKTQGFQ